MKILFLTDVFPPSGSGGAGVVAYYLAKELQKQGHELFIITTVQGKSLEGIDDFDGLRIYKIYANYHPRWQAWLSLYNPRVTSEVKRIIKKIKPDIVHAHNIHRHISYHCLKIAKKYSKAVFLTAHDVMLVHYGKLMPKDGNCFYKISICDQIKEAGKRYNPFRNMLIKHYLKYIDKIFAVSDSLKKVLEINGIKNVETIYNGIDVDDWKIDLEKVEDFKIKYNLKNKKIILFGGRLSGAKGGDQILKAIALIKEKVKNVILIIAGEKNKYTERAEKLIKELDIKENVIFTGWLEGENLIAAYNSIDVFVLPSLCFDSFPTMILEAMACKKPVVSTCFGGSNEIVVDGETGYLIDPNNVDLMSDKIIDLLKNPQKAEQFGEAGHQRIKNEFHLDIQLEKTLEWYKTISFF